MNEKSTTSDICLWCDAHQREDHVSHDWSPPKKKFSRDEKKKEANETYKNLKVKHKYSTLIVIVGKDDHRWTT